jgi:hypothetical protein
MRQDKQVTVKSPNPDGTPRVQRFYGESLYRVKKLAPWAVKIAKVGDMRIAYESAEEYAEKHGVGDVLDIVAPQPKQKITDFRPRPARKPRKVTPSMVDSLIEFVDRMESKGREDPWRIEIS